MKNIYYYDLKHLLIRCNVNVKCIIKIESIK